MIFTDSGPGAPAPGVPHLLGVSRPQRLANRRAARCRRWICPPDILSPRLASVKTTSRCAQPPRRRTSASRQQRGGVPAQPERARALPPRLRVAHYDLCRCARSHRGPSWPRSLLLRSGAVAPPRAAGCQGHRAMARRSSLRCSARGPASASTSTRCRPATLPPSCATLPSAQECTPACPPSWQAQTGGALGSRALRGFRVSLGGRLGLGYEWPGGMPTPT